MCLYENIFTHPLFFWRLFQTETLWTLFNFDFYFRQFSFFMSAEAIYSKGKRLIFDLQKLIEFEKNLGIGGEGGGAYVSLFQTNNFYWKDQILSPTVWQKWNRKMHNSQLLWKYYEHYAGEQVTDFNGCTLKTSHGLTVETSNHLLDKDW